MKEVVKKLNKIFMEGMKSLEAQWQWEKQTPLVVIKIKKWGKKDITFTHICNVEKIRDAKGRERLYWYSQNPVLDVRFADDKLEKQLDEIWNAIKELEKKRDQLLKDRFYELRPVPDEIIEKYQEEKKRLFG
jgi:hypothetical protein